MKRRTRSAWILVRLCAALAIVAAARHPARGQSPLNITPPQRLHSSFETDSGDDEDPRVFTDDQGLWLAVWRSNDDRGAALGDDYDILFSRSTDHGQTWTTPSPLNSNADSDIGDDWTPHLATDGAGNWVAVWQSNEDLDGTIGADMDILVARSSDNGLTWTAPDALNGEAFGFPEPR